MGTEHEHCWHVRGIGTNPAAGLSTVTEACCHCGLTQTTETTDKLLIEWTTAVAHGPYCLGDAVVEWVHRT